MLYKKTHFFVARNDGERERESIKCRLLWQNPERKSDVFGHPIFNIAQTRNAKGQRILSHVHMYLSFMILFYKVSFGKQKKKVKVCVCVRNGSGKCVRNRAHVFLGNISMTFRVGAFLQIASKYAILENLNYFEFGSLILKC